ncbi:hypothetical protein [Phaeobacter sp. CECT 5382]|uniref:hypothetical protein n=1 Tax=Phaeobacter sp. CECT 5382 TaxID=1712645 RepID=UPI0018D1F854|nr:hypothetical protein [Phaeobacter sp. CECT 5382]
MLKVSARLRTLTEPLVWAERLTWTGFLDDPVFQSNFLLTKDEFSRLACRYLLWIPSLVAMLRKAEKLSPKKSIGGRFGPDEFRCLGKGGAPAIPKYILFFR